MNKEKAFKLRFGTPKFMTAGRQVICVLTLECDGWSFTDKGVATCHEDDQFDFKKGSRIAICRAKRKLLGRLYARLGGYSGEKNCSSTINKLIDEWGRFLRVRVYKTRITDELNKLAYGQ